MITNIKPFQNGWLNLTPKFAYNDFGDKDDKGEFSLDGLTGIHDRWGNCGAGLRIVQLRA